MIKAVLFDIDGVVLKQAPLFSKRYAQEHEVDIEDVNVFFHGVFKDCIIGEADLKEQLPRYLKRWNYEGSVEDFLTYWFSADEEDPQVLKIVDSLHAVGIDCHLASNQEKYRAEFLLDDFGLSSKFDEAFFSSDLKSSKSKPEFFTKVLSALNLKPNEVLFVDDDPKNIEIAESVGIESVLYTDISDLRNATTALLAN